MSLKVTKVYGTSEDLTSRIEALRTTLAEIAGPLNYASLTEAMVWARDKAIDALQKDDVLAGGTVPSPKAPEPAWRSPKAGCPHDWLLRGTMVGLGRDDVVERCRVCEGTRIRHVGQGNS